MYIRGTQFPQRSVISCTGKGVYVSMGYIEHNYFLQWFQYYISVPLTFQKNQACIFTVCSLHLNQPAFQHCIRYFLLIPQKCLICNNANIFFERKKKTCQSFSKTSYISPRQIHFRKHIFSEKRIYFRLMYAQNQPLIWLRYAYLQWNPALLQYIASCIPLLLFHTRT